MLMQIKLMLSSGVVDSGGGDVGNTMVMGRKKKLLGGRVLLRATTVTATAERRGRMMPQ
jgi:hypothetical protein